MVVAFVKIGKTEFNLEFKHKYYINKVNSHITYGKHISIRQEIR